MQRARAAAGTALSLSPVHTTNMGAIKLPCESPEQPEGNDLTTLPEFVRRTSSGNSFVRRTSSGNPSLQRHSLSSWEGIMDVVNNFYAPIYQDSLNSLYNESELISELEAINYVQDYIERRKNMFGESISDCVANSI
jgi:hypothetical protein